MGVWRPSGRGPPVHGRRAASGRLRATWATCVAARGRVGRSRAVAARVGRSRAVWATTGHVGRLRAAHGHVRAATGHGPPRGPPTGRPWATFRARGRVGRRPWPCGPLARVAAGPCPRHVSRHGPCGRVAAGRWRPLAAGRWRRPLARGPWRGTFRAMARVGRVAAVGRGPWAAGGRWRRPLAVAVASQTERTLRQPLQVVSEPEFRTGPQLSLQVKTEETLSFGVAGTWPPHPPSQPRKKPGESFSRKPRGGRNFSSPPPDPPSEEGQVTQPNSQERRGGSGHDHTALRLPLVRRHRRTHRDP